MTDNLEKVLIGTFALIVLIAVAGFFLISSDAQVPSQFNLDGWTTFRRRNTALFFFIFSGVIGIGVLLPLIRSLPFPLLRAGALALMLLLLGVELAAVLSAT